jgi:hypothetical protein
MDERLRKAARNYERKEISAQEMLSAALRSGMTPGAAVKEFQLRLPHIVYDSNNSGGGWWLDDDDWKNLEKAGWFVEWVRENPAYKDFAESEPMARFLGALATGARFYNTTPGASSPSIQDAVSSFEDVTSEDVDAKGCECCGSPHSFYSAWDYEKDYWFDGLEN